jgi:TetR/AcrR family transcriptional regulator of autoinduction and epiphytic fitness
MSERDSKGKLQDRQVRKRESILRAAVKAFEGEGYEGASMDRIAIIAGASKRTVYNYFDSKESLLRAVIEELVEGQNQLKQIPYDPEQTLESQLAKFVDAELYMINDSSRLSLVRILTSVFVRNPGLCEESSKESPSQHANLAAWLEAAAADERVSVNDPELAARLFYGMIQGIFNFPALFFSPQPQSEHQPIMDEAIAVFLSRYRRAT